MRLLRAIAWWLGHPYQSFIELVASEYGPQSAYPADAGESVRKCVEAYAAEQQHTTP